MSIFPYDNKGIPSKCQPGVGRKDQKGPKLVNVLS